MTRKSFISTIALAATALAIGVTPFDPKIVAFSETYWTAGPFDGSSVGEIDGGYMLQRRTAEVCKLSKNWKITEFWVNLT